MTYYDPEPRGCDNCGQVRACVRCYRDETNQCCQCTSHRQSPDGYCDECRPEDDETVTICPATDVEAAPRG